MFSWRGLLCSCDNRIVNDKYSFLAVAENFELFATNLYDFLRGFCF